MVTEPDEPVQIDVGRWEWPTSGPRDLVRADCYSGHQVRWPSSAPSKAHFEALTERGWTGPLVHPARLLKGRAKAENVVHVVKGRSMHSPGTPNGLCRLLSSFRRTNLCSSQSSASGRKRPHTASPRAQRSPRPRTKILSSTSRPRGRLPSDNPGHVPTF
jgi:hypothetical protein